eukprot:CAMPEP_0204829338 /NCGR_PEP_ID=MMETSP1346-20131115/7455_1 /ASSEMBLY_ACC=CAM_ASM_000771 /TAXON_ID=215587 /ORGANISM="Aplanochytrium stocchinoi, Strain GSBS06" /LENGTH=129 /DNA_ID=CAMNT_0051959035 /DNA_START=170 /DNA_END=559 /DNA_ORIENTATION=-
MVTSLIHYERIKTTVPKAKELRRVADWMVTLGKKGSLHARRQSLKVVRDKAAMHKLFDVLGPRYINRPGGFTRIVRVGHRRGDAADMCVMEFVDKEGELRKAKPVDENTVKRNRGIGLQILLEQDEQRV